MSGEPVVREPIIVLVAVAVGLEVLVLVPSRVEVEVLVVVLVSQLAVAVDLGVVEVPVVEGWLFGVPASMSPLSVGPASRGLP